MASKNNSSISSSPVATSATTTEVKRSAVKELIQRYFYQLQRGCGKPQCSNQNCASSGKVDPTLTANEIAAKAIQLFSQDAKLCEPYPPPSVATTSKAMPTTSSSSGGMLSGYGEQQEHGENSEAGDGAASPSFNDMMDIEGGGSSASEAAHTINGSSSSSTIANGGQSVMRDEANNKSVKTGAGAPHSSGGSTPTLVPTVSYLNEQIIDELIEDYKKTNSLDAILHAINEVFSNVDKLYLSFNSVIPRHSTTLPSEQATTVDSLTKDQLRQQKQEETLVNGITTAAATDSGVVDDSAVVASSSGGLKKEDIRALEGECDKDEDSSATMMQQDDDGEHMEADDAMDVQAAPSASASAAQREKQRSMAANVQDHSHNNSSLQQILDSDDDDDDDDNDNDYYHQRNGANNLPNMSRYNIVDEDDSDPAALGALAAFGLSNSSNNGNIIAHNNLTDDEEDDADDDEERSRLYIDIDDDDDDVAETTSRARHRRHNSDNDDDDDDNDDVNGKAEKKPITDATRVDFLSLRRCKRKLLNEVDGTAIGEALNSNIKFLAQSIKFRHVRRNDWESVIHCLIIGFDLATNSSSNYHADLEYVEIVLPKLCHAVALVPVWAQARIARIWATHCKDQLRSLVECCQQLITLKVILEENTAQVNDDIIATTKVLKIAYYANMLAGVMEPPSISTLTSGATGEASSTANNALDDDDLFFYSQTTKTNFLKFAENKLEKELNISHTECRLPLIPYEEFYNESLSDAIQMDRDYLAYKNISLNPKSEGNYFSFMLYSFILTPATKVLALYYDSRIRMYSERNSSLIAMISYNGDDEINSPELKLKVKRDNLVNDALVGLELIAMGNPKDLKKQLVVEFEGEQGIDEGGVSKEFFQLIVEELFNPDFGMFIHQEDTHTMWFNSSPFENDGQFTLIGIILGLAIYNNIVLPVKFPMVVYRKLMGAKGTFHDLKDWNPTLYKGLNELLAYEEDDMEDVFMTTFKISYKNVFGELIEYELKESGADILVGQHNKREFVDLYSDFLLNKDVERQFRAFKRGFDMVTDESPLKLLFRPEEVELLVCGSRKFDFQELEKSADYEGGYSKDTPIIKYFWEIVHSLPEELKRKLLEFTTGSDRVPVGGLCRLKLLITRNGSDTDRLPTSHTCFNVLLLPEYATKEKLEDRLLKAINYSKGFGML